MVINVVAGVEKLYPFRRMKLSTMNSDGAKPYVCIPRNKAFRYRCTGPKLREKLTCSWRALGQFNWCDPLKRIILATPNK